PGPAEGRSPESRRPCFETRSRWLRSRHEAVKAVTFWLFRWLPLRRALFRERGQALRRFVGLALGGMALDQAGERYAVEIAECRLQGQRLGLRHRHGAVLQ